MIAIFLLLAAVINFSLHINLHGLFDIKATREED